MSVSVFFFRACQAPVFFFFPEFARLWVLPIHFRMCRNSPRHHPHHTSALGCHTLCRSSFTFNVNYHACACHMRSSPFQATPHCFPQIFIRICLVLGTLLLPCSGGLRPHLSRPPFVRNRSIVPYWARWGARVGPLQLRSSSECRRDSPNASLMLRTSGCISYTLNVACRLNVRCVLQQSRPEIRRSRRRCVVGQATCETVKVPIVNVHLTFTDHPSPKTLGHTLRSHGGLPSSFFESLHTQHSGTDHQSVGRLSSSLPLHSAPYASTSPRALRTPQHASIPLEPIVRVLA